MAHKGIHSRGYLPHWDFADSVQAVTFRLADSLPNKVVKEWREELRVAIDSPDTQVSQKARADLQQRISHFEDAGHGSCLLAKPEHAKVVQDALIKGHGTTYKLIDWCIMPNHVHVLIRLLDETPLGKVIKHWKAPTAVEINRLENRTGSFWMIDYHDRLIRDLDHLHNAKAYIRNNPVKAGICEKPEDWAFSSAGNHWSAEFIPREDEDSRDINFALPVTGSALNGHLDLRCEVRADGVPFIAQQSFRAPVHLGKSHLDQGQLVLSIVNPTAGFFDGDQLVSNVHVAAGAKLVLSTPSASRVYRTRSGAAAVSCQSFTVGEDASLEWIPEPFIPHAGARFVQRTEIDLHPAASLLFFDWIAPGRVAMGELFAYQHLRWELDLRLGEMLIARERHDLRPGDDSLEALRAKFPAAHYLSVHAAGEMTTNWPAEALDALSGDDVYLGHGPLTGGVQVIRALCRDSLAARRLLETLRPLLYAAADRKPPALGRIFC
jgi:urease accessory protein